MISLIGLTAGSILAAAALENFLIPFKILDGGLNGIGMIINFLTDLPLSVLIVVLNIHFCSRTDSAGERFYRQICLCDRRVFRIPGIF